MEYKQNASQNIVEQCKMLIEKQNPAVVALFCATQYEPDITALCSLKNIVFCVPRIKNETEMEMKKITSIQNLQPGKWGILEPPEDCQTIAPQDIDIIFIPAVAIDKKNNRIGMGKGFYDRYLAKTIHAQKIGIVFAEQLSQHQWVPNKWDIAMDAVLTNHQHHS